MSSNNPSLPSGHRSWMHKTFSVSAPFVITLISRTVLSMTFQRVLTFNGTPPNPRLFTTTTLVPAFAHERATVLTYEVCEDDVSPGRIITRMSLEIQKYFNPDYFVVLPVQCVKHLTS